MSDCSKISVNCSACGNECFEGDLNTIHLSGFNNAISVCGSCYSKTAEASFKDAVDILNDIVKIAHLDNKSAEGRLDEIRKILS